MKTQITTIAAAIAIAASFSATANQPYTDASLQPDSAAANAEANPRFNTLEGVRSSMNGFSGPAGVRTSEIDQSDNNNFAEVSQAGGPQQYSDVDQSGDNNSSRVRQTGSSQESTIMQIGVAGGLGNRADVYQFNGEFNDSYIYQNGDNNSALVRQQNNSDYSDSLIEQMGSSNEATVTQLNNVDETWSFVSQDGELNVANVEQFQADLSASYIYQSGTEGHLADVYQTGSEQASTIRQNGTAASAYHNQSGANNVAVTTQW